ncbi:MAG: cytochrome c biogenesis protein ResB [Opitutaceae bacterium]
MRDLRQAFLSFFVSLKLTVALLALSIILVFWATLAQVKLGVWGVQEHFFRTFFVLDRIPGTEIPIPVFPGGYFLGSLLLANLVAAHIQRFRLSWKKSGILLTHAGLTLLLVGELMSGLWQEDFQMRLDEGETKNYSESFRLNELVVIDSTDPLWDDVVAIPEAVLAKSQELQHPKLPFRLAVRAYFPNAQLQMKDPKAPAPDTGVPALATRDIGTQVSVTPLRITYRDNERNLPAAFVELIGPEGSLGVWLASTMITQSQTFEYGGKTWRLQFRFEREYKPFSLTLLDFSHDRYPGTEIPKNFSSRIRLKTEDGKDDREVLIYMNNPLRYAGLTFYQASFDNNDRTTVLQVVKNPSWLLPYISCALMTLGLLIQFGMHLVGFVRKRTSTPATVRA